MWADQSEETEYWGGALKRQESCSTIQYEKTDVSEEM